jgi:ureidoglycolate lyase
MSELIVRARALCAEAFAPFGEVLETEGREFRWINAGTCKRYDDLARIDVVENGGRALLSVFEASPRRLPLRIQVLERHPLSSQAFFPLEGRPFLVVVAEDAPRHVERISAFVSSGRQGVNFRRGTWHHPLIALEAASRFLVLDRGGPDVNCEERSVADRVILVDLPRDAGGSMQNPSSRTPPSS